MASSEPMEVGTIKGLGRLFGWSLVAVVVAGGFYVAEQWRRAAELEAIVARLTGERRVAQAMVLEQRPGESGEMLTTVRFVPLDRDGHPQRARLFTVEGEIVYFEALVLKFDRELVKWGDAMRGKSLHLFRRAYGEHQAPDQGFELEGPDIDDGTPEAFRAKSSSASRPSDLERQLWQDFWRFATDPAAARQAGVRVAQGEAVFTRMKPRVLYDLRLENDGGLNIVPQAWPPAVPWPPPGGGPE